jgi:hypothetical protein
MHRLQIHRIILKPPVTLLITTCFPDKIHRVKGCRRRHNPVLDQQHPVLLPVILLRKIITSVTVCLHIRVQRIRVFVIKEVHFRNRKDIRVCLTEPDIARNGILRHVIIPGNALIVLSRGSLKSPVDVCGKAGIFV